MEPETGWVEIATNIFFYDESGSDHLPSKVQEQFLEDTLKEEVIRRPVETFLGLVHLQRGPGVHR
jgi:hypothetical protein